MQFSIPFIASIASLISLATAAAPTTRHFYTCNPGGEYAPSYGYGLRLQVGLSLQNGGAGTTVLWRCRTGGADFFTFLTTDPNCEGAAGYVREGGVTNIFTTRQPGTYELRRLYNSRGDHTYYLYNPDTGAGPYGYYSCDVNQYALEGRIGYIYPVGGSSDPNAVPLYAFRKGCNSDRDTCCN